MPSIYVGILAYQHSMATDLGQSLLRAQVDCTQHDIGFTVHIIDGHALISHARNIMVAEFLTSDSTHLLFVDYDVGFEPTGPRRLLSHNVDVIGAAVPFRIEGMGWQLLPVTRPPQPDHRGLIEVVYLSTSMCMLSRNALVGLRDDNPDGWVTDHTVPDMRIHSIFGYRVVDRVYQTEDTVMCAKWRSLGGRCWVDPSIATSHQGIAVFSGRLSDDMAGGNL